MTVELASYLRLVRRHWLSSVLFGLAGLAFGLVLTLVLPAGYQATAGVFAPATPTYLTLDVGSPTASPTQPPREWTQDTESELLHSEVVLQAAAARLGGHWTAAELSNRMQVSVPTSTRVFAITVTADDPDDAQRAALTVAKEYTARRADLLAARAERVSKALRARRAILAEILGNAPDDAGDGAERATPATPFPVDATLRAHIRDQIARIDTALSTAAGTTANGADLVDPPQQPRRPTHTNAEVPPVSGLMTGLLGGMAFGFVRERRHPYVRSIDDVTDATQAPVVAEFDGGLLQTPTSRRTQDAVERLAGDLRDTLVDRADSDPARVLVTGCCAESLVIAFADQLRRSFEAGSAMSATSAAEVTVVSGRIGSAGTSRRARTADAVLLLAELGGTTRTDLRRSTRILGRGPGLLAVVTIDAAPAVEPSLRTRSLPTNDAASRSAATHAGTTP